MRDLSSIATDDLTPAKLSNSFVCWTWALIYSAIHLVLVASLHFQIFETFSPEYYVAFFLLIGLPIILLPELYIRTILRPYRHEMIKRGGMPPRTQRVPPYDRSEKIIGTFILGASLLALPAAQRFIFFDVASRFWSSALILVVAGAPVLFASIPLSIRFGNSEDGK